MNAAGTAISNARRHPQTEFTPLNYPTARSYTTIRST